MKTSHPRTLGWIGTSSLAMGGSNQSLFLMSALFVGQGDILGQGSAAIPLLILGLLLSYMAAPGWVELVLMFPNRVGGIAATCSEAFRPYSPVLANLTGICYWYLLLVWLGSRLRPVSTFICVCNSSLVSAQRIY